VSNLRQDTLFLACTRPAMAMGLPQDALAVLVIVCGEISQWFFYFHHVVLALVFNVICYGVCWGLAAYDPHIFRALRVWLQTSLRASINADDWGGASVSPAPAPAYRRSFGRGVVGITVHA
jgi:type IV secretion system protein VirB3